MLADVDTAAALLSAAASMLAADAGVGDGGAAAAAEEEEDALEVDAAGGGGDGGYAAAFVQLSFAAEAEADLYAEHTPQRYFASAVSQLGAAQPAALQQAASKLPADKQQQLQQLMALQ